MSTASKAGTIPDLLAQAPNRFPSKPAVIDPGRSFTFADLYRQATTVACELRALGVSRGQRVGVLMEKSAEQIVAILGVLCANAIMVPMHPAQKPRGIEHVIRNCGMTALITETALLAGLANLSAEVKLVIGRGKPDDAYPLPVLDHATARSASFFDCTGEDSAAIIYSSGSTGLPKGILLSHDNLVRGARLVSSYLGTTADDRIALVLTLTSDYGLNQLWQSLYQGATLVLHDFFLPSDLLEFLETYRITALPLMPAVASKIFDPRLSRTSKEYDLSLLRYVTSTGAVVTPKMLSQLQGLFRAADVYLMYGLTEAFRSTYLPPAELARRPGSIGKAIPEVEVHILDEDGQPCAAGVCGELVHRGGCITKGYWQDAAATAHRFRELARFPGEKVVFSGDIAKRDEDGFLYFVGRRDAMIKTRGFRVSPGEIEQAAAACRGITAAVAFGLRNAECDSDVVLAYACGPQSVDAGSIANQLRKELPYYMVPTHLVQLSEFPTVANGAKIDRVGVIVAAKEKLGLSATPPSDAQTPMAEGNPQ